MKQQHIDHNSLLKPEQIAALRAISKREGIKELTFDEYEDDHLLCANVSLNGIVFELNHYDDLNFLYSCKSSKVGFKELLGAINHTMKIVEEEMAREEVWKLQHLKPAVKFESADLKPTPTYTVEQVHSLLERQPFADSYIGLFEDYITSGDGTKSLDEMRTASLAKLAELLKDFGSR